MACVLDNPTKAAICLGGKWLNLSAIGRSQGLNKSYLSRVFSGERSNPPLDVLLKISAATGMGLEDLVTALLERWKLIKEQRTEAEIKYLTRVVIETEEDIATARKGKPVIPRDKGERLPQHHT